MEMSYSHNKPWCIFVFVTVDWCVSINNTLKQNMFLFQFLESRREKGLWFKSIFWKPLLKQTHNASLSDAEGPVCENLLERKRKDHTLLSPKWHKLIGLSQSHCRAEHQGVCRKCGCQRSHSHCVLIFSKLRHERRHYTLSHFGTSVIWV